MVSSDDKELRGDGIDATRVFFQVTDKFGAPRPFAKGNVAFTINGPGTIIGDNPFNLEESGGSGAIWVKTIINGSGDIILQAAHSQLGSGELKIHVV
jgi:beta-galactosidase